MCFEIQADITTDVGVHFEGGFVLQIEGNRMVTRKFSPVYITQKIMVW